MSDIPEGFVQVLRAPFINHVGPILQAVENPRGTMTLGLQVAEVHSNTMGYMHGGMIATLADSCMARAMHTLLERRTLTLKMSLEYMDAVKKGDFLIAHGRLVGHDETAAWTECDLKVGDRLAARASAVFRLFRKKTV